MYFIDGRASLSQVFSRSSDFRGCLYVGTAACMMHGKSCIMCLHNASLRGLLMQLVSESVSPPPFAALAVGKELRVYVPMYACNSLGHLNCYKFTTAKTTMTMMEV